MQIRLRRHAAAPARFVLIPTWSGSRVALASLGALCVWALLTVSTLVQPGYDVGTDSISALASRGAALPWLAVAAIALAGMGTIAISTVVRGTSPGAALTVGLAGICLIVVAFSRISCPAGGAGCVMSQSTDEITGRMHWTATVLYEVTFLATLACLALANARMRRRRVSVILAGGLTASLLIFAGASAFGTGIAQHIWLAIHSVITVGIVSEWTVPSTTTVGSQPARTHEYHGRSPAQWIA